LNIYPEVKKIYHIIDHNNPNHTFCGLKTNSNDPRFALTDFIDKITCEKCKDNHDEYWAKVWKEFGDAGFFEPFKA
jgi:hypothetical protein